MTLNIDLADDQVVALTAKAQAQGVSAEQYARRDLELDIQTFSRRRDIFRSDGASQHDRYIYCTVLCHRPPSRSSGTRRK